MADVDMMTVKSDPWAKLYREDMASKGVKQSLTVKEAIEQIAKKFPSWDDGSPYFDIGHCVIGGVLKKRCEFCRHYEMGDNEELCHKHLDDSNHPTYCEGCVENCCDFDLSDVFRDRAISEFEQMELMICQLVSNYYEAEYQKKEQDKKNAEKAEEPKTCDNCRNKHLCDSYREGMKRCGYTLETKEPSECEDYERSK